MTYMERMSTNVVSVLLVLTALVKEWLYLHCVPLDSTVLKDPSSRLLALQELTIFSQVYTTLVNVSLAVLDSIAHSLE